MSFYPLVFLLRRKFCGNLSPYGINLWYRYLISRVSLVWGWQKTVCGVKAAVLQNILKIISYKYFKISLQIYIIAVRNKKPTYLLLKTDNSFFCHRDIPTIHNGYCVSNAEDYAKKTDVLPTNMSTEFVVSNNKFLHWT